LETSKLSKQTLQVFDHKKDGRTSTLPFRGGPPHKRGGGGRITIRNEAGSSRQNYQHPKSSRGQYGGSQRFYNKG